MSFFDDILFMHVVPTSAHPCSWLDQENVKNKCYSLQSVNPIHRRPAAAATSSCSLSLSFFLQWPLEESDAKLLQLSSVTLRALPPTSCIWRRRRPRTLSRPARFQIFKDCVGGQKMEFGTNCTKPRDTMQTISSQHWTVTCGLNMKGHYCLAWCSFGLDNSRLVKLLMLFIWYVCLHSVHFEYCRKSRKTEMGLYVEPSLKY
jgi:hypothetical protein